MACRFKSGSGYQYILRMEDDNIKKFDDEIDLTDLFFALWKRKILISLITSVAAIFSVYYALSLANIYTSKALLAPSASEDSLSSKLGGYSSLAGLAGFTIPSQTGRKATEAIERIKSYDFFVNQFLPNIKLENLAASKDWNQKDNEIIYDDALFDSSKSLWVRDVSYPLLPTPSNQEAFEIYREILSVSEDKKTTFVSISIDHVSPFIAEQWVKTIIKSINNHMRDIDKDLAETQIKYLKESLEKTNLSDVRRVMSSLIQDQVQVLMLAEASDDYVFKPIVSPIAPEKKSKPSRALICILGTIIGFMISITLSLYLHYFRK
ncbi:MAG: chain length determinant protein [Flavobacteriaceae bacterium]|nr:chain length determinant protein [Flavobacteriaceae bacterium]